jgi:hypothetical protein
VALIILSKADVLCVSVKVQAVCNNRDGSRIINKIRQIIVDE